MQEKDKSGGQGDLGKQGVDEIGKQGGAQQPGSQQPGSVGGGKDDKDQGGTTPSR